MVHGSLPRVYLWTEEVEARKENRGRWCADTLCIASFHVWFESRMNMQRSLIRRHKISEFELGLNVRETAKNLSCTKVDGAVDLSRSFKKFWVGYRNRDEKSARLKTVYFEAIVLNLASSTRRVSGEFEISHSGLVYHLHKFGKSNQSCWIVSSSSPTKYLFL